MLCRTGELKKNSCHVGPGARRRMYHRPSSRQQASGMPTPRLSPKMSGKSLLSSSSSSSAGSKSPGPTPSAGPGTESATLSADTRTTRTPKAAVAASTLLVCGSSLRATLAASAPLPASTVATMRLGPPDPLSESRRTLRGEGGSTATRTRASSTPAAVANCRVKRRCRLVDQDATTRLSVTACVEGGGDRGGRGGGGDSGCSEGDGSGEGGGGVGGGGEGDVEVGGG